MLRLDLHRLIADFRRDRRASVMLIFSLLLIPILFAAGMGVDYATAARKRSKLNAAADSAALAAVTPTVMALNSQQAMQTAATNMFNALAAQVTGLQNPPKLSVVVCPSSDASCPSNPPNMTVTVSYTANVLTTFSGIIGRNTLAIGGHSQSSPPTPYINFYLLLDDSPSMAIAATTDGINTMVANTANQCGCAFACHESSPQSERYQSNCNAKATWQAGLGNEGGVNQDNYALAQKLGVKVRMDLLGEAVKNLMGTAQQGEGSNNYYQMAIYTFDNGFNLIQDPLTPDLTAAQNSAANIQLQEVWSNNYVANNVYNNDTNTDFANAMSNMILKMNTPGNGSSQQNAQGYLFIVTDGLEDYMVNNDPNNRVYSPIDTSYCTTVKNKGIKIAVLYTEYLPLPLKDTGGNTTWYATHVASVQPKIQPALQACASPGLFATVTTDGDISAALTNLFNEAVSQAHLTQ